MNSLLRSISNYLIAFLTLAMGVVFMNNEQVWVDFDFRTTTAPEQIYWSSSTPISPNKAADGVCTQGMVQINKDEQFFVDLPSLSYLQLNIKSTNTASARNIQVAYKKAGQSDFTVIATPFSVSAPAALMLHEMYAELKSDEPVVVRIIPTNGNIQVHDVLAKGLVVLGNDATIYSFKLDQQISSVIDHDNETITVEVPLGANITNVVPAGFNVATGATVIPDASLAQNFSNPFVYTVTAPDGVTQKQYTVTVNSVSSSHKEITAFKLFDQQIGNAVINEETGVVTITIPEGIAVGSLVPEIFEISPYATISPVVTGAQNFADDVSYTITAQNGTTKTWKITIVEVSASDDFTIYEAEEAEFTGKEDAQHNGFTGTGFVDFQTNGENSINFTVCQVEAGAYQASFRYALGKAEERKGRLYVNDYYITTLEFEPGTTFTDWKEETVVLNLDRGINNISITWEETDGPNLDNLKLQGEACPKYSIQVTTNNNGEVSLNPSRKNNLYFEDEIVTLLAVERPDLKFHSWGGDLEGDFNPIALSVEKNHVINANFTVVNTYQLNVAVQGLGSVTLNPAGGVYAEGTTVTVTALPALSNQFIGWSGDLSGAVQTSTIVMNANKNVTARFTNDIAVDFEKPIGFAGVVTTEYSNFNGPTTGGQGAEDTLWINGPADFDLLATSLYHRNRAYKNNRVENGMKPAPLVIVLKEGVYPEGTSSSSAWGNSMMTVQEQGDLTIIGQGEVVLKWGLNIKRSWNILIRNLNFQEYKDDGINIGEPETHHIWVDHCTVGHPTARPANQNSPDGGIDIKNGASYVTVSWTKYQNSWKTGLVGHSDGNGAKDLGKLKVTYFANHFYNSNSRNPRVRFGEVHVLNNLSELVTLYGIAASNTSQVLAEGNFYLNTRWPMYADRTAADFKAVYGNNTDNGFTSKTGNREAKGLKILNNEYDDSGLPVITSQINPERLNPGGRSVKFDEFNPQEVFTPPYSYQAYPASVVRTIVPLFAGAGKVDFFNADNNGPVDPVDPEPPVGLIAFPGAEGFGKYATGGRGGKVVAVTNLQDNGPGSFREALTQHPDEPLTVVFNVGGVIELQSDIKVNRSNLTIAGQTAPGDGICLTGASFIINGARSLSQGGNHGNIIIRYLRSRPIANDPNGKYGIGLENVHNVILDHCSFSWANEENAALYDTKYTSVQWSIISEGLYSAGHSKGNRSYGGVWGGQYASYHHNLLAHNNGRTVRFNGARAHDTVALVDYRNNVVYNWGTEGHATGGEIEIAGGESKINLVNNYYKPGPATPGRRNFIRPNTPGADKVGLFYLSGNVMDGNTEMSANNNLGVNWNSGFDHLASSNLSAQPFNVSVALPVVSAVDAYNAVMENAGATLPKRDAVDTRIINETKTGTATGTGSRNLPGIIDNPSVVGGLPAYQPGTAIVDTDGDGIPDAYEVEKGLNPNDAGDGSAITSSGYSNLELYINSIVAKGDDGGNPNPPVSKSVSATWSLLSGQNATEVSEELIAHDQVLGSKITGVNYGNRYGNDPYTERIWQRAGNDGLGLYDENSYVDYKIEHKNGEAFNVDSFSVAIVGGGTGNVRTSVVYSIDGGVTFMPLASAANPAYYNGASTLAYSEGGVDPGDHTTLINSGAVAAAAAESEFLRFGNLDIQVPASKSIVIRLYVYLRAEGGVRHVGQHSAYIGARTAGEEEPVTPSVELISDLKNFNQVLPNTSAVQQYKVVFKQVEEPVNVSVTAPYEISVNGGNWLTQATYQPAKNPDTATVSVRLNGAATGAANGSITNTVTGFEAMHIPLSGNILQPGSVTPDVIVAKDGSGDFTSIQAAINAAPSNRTTPWVIFIKNGKYFEKVAVPQNKTFIHLVGESVANTIITYDDYSGRKLPDGTTIGTSTSHTLHVRGNDFAALNLTVENSYGVGSQAVAVHVQADRVVFKNCRFLGHQDTLLVNGNGYKQYFVNCYIDGDVDYIFGSAIAVFESCVVYSKTRSANGGSYITAANTPAGQAHGLVFRNCEMPSNRGNTLYVYGRPWQNDSGSSDKAHNKTVLINTTIGTNVISPAGWAVWNSGTDTDLIFYAEHGTKHYNGSPVDLSQRVAWSKQLTQQQADEFTNANIFGDWDPCAVTGGICDPFSADVAVSNFKVDKTTTQANVTWNISWPLANVKYELFKSLNGGNWEKVYETNTGNAYDINFGFAENLPAAGSNFKYYLKASLAGYDEHLTDTIEVSSIPTMMVNGNLGEFKQGVGLASAPQVYTLKASNILEPIKILVPAPFEISVDGGTTWENNQVTILNETENFDTQINVRLNSTATGSYNAVIKHGTHLADTVSITASGIVQSEPLPISEVAVHYPLTVNQNDDAAIRNVAFTPTAIRLNNYELSDGSVAIIPAFSDHMGMAFAPKASGLWGSNDGGPGGNLNKNFYVEFSVTPSQTNKVRIDTLGLTASYYNTSSNTRFAVEYSLDGFNSDVRSVTGGVGQGNILASTANGAWSTPILLPNNTSTNNTAYYLALNNADGIWIEEGKTITFRLYFSCGSTSAGRYAKIKDLVLKGDHQSNIVPTITVDDDFESFYQTIGTPSVVQTYTVTGTNLTNDVQITVVAPYQISADNQNYAQSVTLTKASLESAPATISVRLNATAVGGYDAKIIHQSAGANNVELNISGNTVAAPVIPGLSVTGAVTRFEQTIGTPTAPQSVEVKATNLTGNVHVIIPPGFEVSLNRVQWTGSSQVLVLQPTNGTINTMLYIRMNNNTNTSISGDIQLLYGNLNQKVSVEGAGVVAMRAHPNPATTHLTVTHPQLYVVATINIYTIDGVKVGTYRTASNTAQTKIYVGNLKNGMYYVEFIRSNERKVFNFIKQ
jgi:pectin methylesterase-like acyl-CoA thioesterase/pectate lyase